MIIVTKDFLKAVLKAVNKAITHYTPKFHSIDWFLYDANFGV